MALVTIGPRLRDQQRAAIETAILDAAWAPFARCGPVGTTLREATAADPLLGLLDVARSTELRLAPGDLSGAVALDRPLEPAPGTAKEALLRSAVELFAEGGPASVSVRDLARHAGVNQGLIYRHFGSKQALLAAAIETGSSILLTAALSTDGFDFDAMSHLMPHGSPAPRMIARTLVDDVGITTVRVQFPVLHQLLDRYDQVPTGSGPADLTDPRVAVATAAAMALGSVIWGCHLRTALGLSDRDGIESALADLARHLLSVPTRALAGSDRAP